MYAYMCICYLKRKKFRLVSIVLLNIFSSDSYLGEKGGGELDRAVTLAQVI